MADGGCDEESLVMVRLKSGVHYGTKPGHFETLKIHFPTSEGVSEVSQRANKGAQQRA